MLPLLLLIATLGRFTSVAGFDYDLEGNLYVVDRETSTLVKYSSRGDSLMAVGGRGNDQMQFDVPVAVYARRGTDVYVADHINHRIQRFDHNLDYISTLYTRDDGDERNRFGYPRDVAVTRQGDVLVVDGENRRVVKFNAFGIADRTFGEIGDGRGRLIDPVAVEVDGRDFVYVLDGERIAVFDAFGSYLSDVGLPLDHAPTSFSIDSDTLIASDSVEYAIIDLQAPSVIAIDTLPMTSPTLMRMMNGNVIVAEGRHLGIYKLGTQGTERGVQE